MSRGRFSPPSLARLLLGIMLISASSVPGADTYWTAAEGDWFDNAKWTQGVPGPADSARIGYVTNGATTLDAAGAVVGDLQMGQSGYTAAFRIGPSGELFAGNNLYVGRGSPGALEVDGGTLLHTNDYKYLYIGYGAGVTGSVVQTGGTVDVGYLDVGYNGIGEYTLHDGILNLSSTGSASQWIALNAGSVGTLTQNGGILRVKTTTLCLGENGTATVHLNGGTTVVDSAYARVAYKGDSTVNINGGNLLVTNDSLYVAFSDGTGRVVQTAGRVETHHLYHARVGEAHYTLDGGELALGGNAFIGYGFNGSEASGTFTQGGGIATVEGDEFSIACNPATRGSHTMTNGVLDLNGTVRLFIGKHGVGDFVMSDGVITNARNIYLSYGAGSTGTMVQTGGRIHMNQSTFLGYNADSGATFMMSGGLLDLSPTHFDYWGGWGTTAYGHVDVVQTGGTIFKGNNVDEKEWHLGGAAESSCRYEISGGRLIATNIMFRLYGSNTVLRIVGSAAELRIGRFYSSNHEDARTEFILDKSTKHISTIYGYSTVCRASGTLAVGFKGGFALARTNAFDLMDVAGHYSTYDYHHKPPVEMWTCGWVDNQPPDNHDIYRATLATGAGSWHQGTLDLNGQNSLSFPAATTGSLTVLNLDTRDEYWGLYLRLDADPGSRTMGELVTYMQQAGYSNVAAEAAGSYDVVVYMDAADTQDGLTDGPSWFLWDLGGFDPAATISAVMAYEHRPRGTAIMIR